MASQELLQRRIDAFPENCRKAGLKLTPQRSAIFSMLASTESHPTPEEVYSEIRKNTPSISLATVYKVLDLFHSRGFVRRVSTRDQVARYDAHVEPHHHLICTACGRIQDVADNAIAPAGVGVPGNTDFLVRDYEIQFHGLCGACRD